MKKLLLLSAAALAFQTTFAQDASSGEPRLKPVTGSSTLEVQLVPFSSSPLSLIDGIRFRSFTDELTALRLTVNAGYFRNSTITRDKGTGANTQPELTTTTSGFNFSVKPGIEKHFEGTRRLSPYLGGEVGIGFNTTREVEESDDPQNQDKVVETVTRNENGNINFLLNGLAGADLYVAQNFYLGLEMRVGIRFDRPMATKVKPPTGDEIETRENKNSGFSFGTSVLPAIRVGYVF